MKLATPLFSVVKIHTRTHVVDYVDTITKRGDTAHAKQLYDSENFYHFDAESQRQIAFHAGCSHTSQAPTGLKKDRSQLPGLFIIVFVSLYAVTYFSSNFIGSTVINLGSFHGFDFVVPAAIFLYSFTFLFDAIIAEVYGPSMCRSIYTIIAMVSMVVIIMIFLVGQLPTLGDNYIKAFLYNNNHNVLLVFFVSVTSFVCSQYLNATIIGRLKYIAYRRSGNAQQRHNNRLAIIYRFIGASLIATSIDSCIFCFGVFSFYLPLNVVAHIALTQFLFKVSYDIIFSPISSSIAIYAKRLDKIDVVEVSPFTYKNVLDFGAFKKAATTK